MTLTSLQQIADDIWAGEGQSKLHRIIFQHADRREVLRLFRDEATFTLRGVHIVLDAQRWIPQGLAAFVYADGTVYMVSINGLGYSKAEDMVYVGTL